MSDPSFNLAMAAKVGDSWYTHLSQVEAAMAWESRVFDIRTEAGWSCDEGGWYAPDGTHEHDWEGPFPEEICPDPKPVALPLVPR